MEKKQLIAVANELTTSDLATLIELNKSKILMFYDCGGFAITDEVRNVSMNGTCIQLTAESMDGWSASDEESYD